MTLPLFTLTGNISSLIGGNQIPSTGMALVLKSNIRAGDLLTINGSAKFVGTVNALLDSSGNINGGNGIKLLANDPILGLVNSVQWTVTSTGRPGYPMLNPFTFDAPTTGSTMDILNTLPVIGVTALGTNRGPQGPQGDPGPQGLTGLRGNQGPPGPQANSIDGGASTTVYANSDQIDAGAASTNYGSTTPLDGGTS